MATILESGISLHGAPTGHDKQKAANHAILVNLNDQTVKDLQQCSQTGKAIQLLGGKSPRIRFAGKILELNVKPEAFRHEIYSASTPQAGDAAFTSLVSYQAGPKTTEKRVEQESAGDLAALEALKQSLASAAQDKEARKTKISNSVIPTGGKNSRSLYLQRQPASLLDRSSGSSSAIGTSLRGIAPTSAPTDSHIQAREKGMRVVLVHLLAVSPATEDDIFIQTRIPRIQLSSLLLRIADKTGTKWELSNKTFKDLDPWHFRYKTEDQRRKAIDNAIRAFDRLRIVKDDKVWQILLPKEERGKGKTLSRLNLAVDKAQQGGTPGMASSPFNHPDQTTASTAGTPRDAASSTPRTGATAIGRSTGGMSIEKRLKEAAKKRAVEEAKEKKRKDKEAQAASDRESKPRVMAPKRVPVKKAVESKKIKSDEVVHSSGDEEDGEIKEASSKPIDKPTKAESASSKVKTMVDRRDSSASDIDKSHRKADVNVRPSAVGKLVSGDTLRKNNSPATPKPKTTATVSSSIKSEQALPKAKVKDTASLKQPPAQRTGRDVASGTPSASQQISPRKADNKPKVPSPLGTTQPHNASNDSKKPREVRPIKATPAMSTPVNAAKPVKQVIAATKSAGIGYFGDMQTQRPVIKKRMMEQTDDNDRPRKVSKLSTNTTTKATTNSTSKATTNGISKATTNSTTKPSPSANTDNNLKRKANDLSSGLHDHGPPAPKHRKTDSSSAHSQAPTTSSVTSLTSAPTVSPAPSSITSPASVQDADSSGKPILSFEQAVDAAGEFLTEYTVYTELYDKLESLPAKDQRQEDLKKLLEMQNRLSRIKKGIEEAAEWEENPGDGAAS